jgi:hypothetical protein
MMKKARAKRRGQDEVDHRTNLKMMVIGIDTALTRRRRQLGGAHFTRSLVRLRRSPHCCITSPCEHLSGVTGSVLIRRRRRAFLGRKFQGLRGLKRKRASHARPLGVILWLRRILRFYHAGEPCRGFSPAGDIAIHERFYKHAPEPGFPRDWVIDGFHASAARASLLR